MIKQTIICILTALVLQEMTCEYQVKDVEIEMVYVEGGSFEMGATPEQGTDADADEKPVRKVTLKGFYMGKYEITQAQWKAVMGDSPSFFKGAKLPVEKVSWNDVQEFLERLNTHTGLHYRLPTEAEWEYAARGGIHSAGYLYSGGFKIGDIAWYCRNSDSRTHPVGSTKFHNELGIYDLSGNVREWCQDWYGAYGADWETNPQGPSKGEFRVIRGGGWDYYPEGCRTSARGNAYATYRLNDLGFRVVLDKEKPD